MNKVLPWIKSNMAIVVLGVLMVAALVLGPIFSGGWNAKVRENAGKRADKLSSIDSLAKSTVTINIPGKPPVEVKAPVNRYLLDEYKRLSTELREDATKVRELALAHNRKGRGVLIPRLFPEMPFVERDTLPDEMHKTTLNAFTELLRQVRAGMPPTTESVRQTLETREEQFITNTLRKKNRKDLDANELQDLTGELSRARLTSYGETATTLGFYCALEALPLPTGHAATATPVQMFGWQWDYWVTEDVLKGLADANEAANGPLGSVVANPVKRVISLRVFDSVKIDPSAGGGASSGASNGPGGFKPPRKGASEEAPVAPPADGSAAPAAPTTIGDPVDPAKEATQDFKASFTGRVTSHLYDVRYAELVVVVSFERLPVVLDALAKRNFITVIGMRVAPADHFAAAAQGFIYGSEPAAVVTMTLETVWLREWTANFMPSAYRAALKIALPATSGQGQAMNPAAPSGTLPST